MEWFRKQVVAIDNEAKHFIDDSFKTLRSAEGAFDMLLKFKHIRSREAVNNQMMRKFNDILLQFGKEVGSTEFSLKFSSSERITREPLRNHQKRIEFFTVTRPKV